MLSTTSQGGTYVVQQDEGREPEQSIVEDLERMGVRLDEAQRTKIAEKIKEIRNFVPKIGVFGKTGAGKSHLCNALFGRAVAKISDVGACTREPQRIVVEAGASGICLIDVPGVGESRERDVEYTELYKNLLPELDIVLWVIKADDRALSVDQEVYKNCVVPFKAKVPTLFVINQVDKLPPIREWDVEGRQPGAAQRVNIDKKVADVAGIFGVTARNITTVSAEEGYNLSNLVGQIVNTLPNEKKFGVVREAKKENVTRESEREAERGVWEAIKDFAGKTYEFYQENKTAIHAAVAAVWKFWVSSKKKK